MRFWVKNSRPSTDLVFGPVHMNTGLVRRQSESKSGPANARCRGHVPNEFWENLTLAKHAFPSKL